MPYQVVFLSGSTADTAKRLNELEEEGWDLICVSNMGAAYLHKIIPHNAPRTSQPYKPALPTAKK